MPYLGNEPAVAYTSTTKDTFSGDGSTTDFTMSKSANVNAVRVVVENVVQNPTVAYTCSGTTLSFTSAPPTGTNNIYVVHLGPPAATVAPPTTINNATTFSDALTVSGAFTSQGIDDNANATAITIDSSENISIGDASYGGSLGQVRIINDASSSPASLALFGHNNVSDGTDFAKIQLAMQTGGVGGNVVAQITGEAEGTAENAAHLTFETATGGTLSEAMRITHDAKVGIGTSAPLRQLHIHNTSANSEIAFTAGTSGVSSILFGDGQTGTDVYRGYLQYNHSDDAMLFASSTAERMRISTNGTLLVGTTGDTTDERVRVSVTSGSKNGISTLATDTNGGTALVCRKSTGASVGSVSFDNNNTAFNTSSDYRLKENVTNVSDGITRVKQLTPKRFNWIDDDSNTVVDGFLAHEVQAVVPEAITGVKDEVEVWKDGQELPEGVSVGDNKLDDDGNTIPVIQNIDQSKLVPLLAAALQEAIAKIEALESENTAIKDRLDALEAG